MMETIPAFDLTRTVAAQPPAEAVTYMLRCARQIAWLDHHSDPSDYHTGTAIHTAMSRFVRQFSRTMQPNLLEVYIRAYTNLRSTLREEHHAA